MLRILLALLLLLIIVQLSRARFIQRGGQDRSDRVVSVYDRNCFFSPMGCHFLKGRRAMTFITPAELKEQQSKLGIVPAIHATQGEKIDACEHARRKPGQTPAGH